MSLHYRLNPEDRTRAMKALTASLSNDRDAYEAVLAELDIDPDGPAARFVHTLCGYCDWIASNTGPVLVGDPGPDTDPRDDPS